MPRLIIPSTRHRQVLDITVNIEQEIKRAKFTNGLCHLFLLHTTAALTTADLDPGTDLDMLDVFQVIIPPLKFRHPHDPEPRAGPHPVVINRHFVTVADKARPNRSRGVATSSSGGVQRSEKS
ncbi:MAG: YjbQ family protein [Candidatus Kerfeldbacteria bacterium]|nr:YjbQ family protein [Candidatus Kerfeldbacteria bacterium]